MHLGQQLAVDGGTAEQGGSNEALLLVEDQVVVGYSVVSIIGPTTGAPAAHRRRFVVGVAAPAPEQAQFDAVLAVDLLSPIGGQARCSVARWAAEPRERDS